MLDVLLLWTALFGVWPFSAPAHDMTTVASVVDLMLHFVAIAWLWRRWTASRRADRRLAAAVRKVWRMNVEDVAGRPVRMDVAFGMQMALRAVYREAGLPPPGNETCT